MSEYWTIYAEAALDEAGLQATREQVATVAMVMSQGHADYGDQHGHREADRGLLRMQREAAFNTVIAFVEEQMAALDGGPNFFERLNQYQKEALARLAHVRQELAARRHAQR